MRSTQRRVQTKSPIRVFKLFTATTFYHYINIYAVYLNDITKIRDIRLPLIIVVEIHGNRLAQNAISHDRKFTSQQGTLETNRYEVVQISNQCN